MLKKYFFWGYVLTALNLFILTGGFQMTFSQGVAMITLNIGFLLTVLSVVSKKEVKFDEKI